MLSLTQQKKEVKTNYFNSIDSYLFRDALYQLEESKNKAKDDEREKSKKEAEEERKIKATRKKQKKNESHQSYRQFNQYSDEEESTIEQIKIRLLDGPTFKTIPDEFKSLSIFHHPIHLIKEFSFSNVNMIFMKLFLFTKS